MDERAAMHVIRLMDSLHVWNWFTSWRLALKRKITSCPQRMSLVCPQFNLNKRKAFCVKLAEWMRPDIQDKNISSIQKLIAYNFEGTDFVEVPLLGWVEFSHFGGQCQSCCALMGVTWSRGCAIQAAAGLLLWARWPYYKTQTRRRHGSVNPAKFVITSSHWAAPSLGCILYKVAQWSTRPWVFWTNIEAHNLTTLCEL